MKNVLFSLIGILVGLLAWRLLAWRAKRSTITGNKLLWLLIAVGFVCRIAFVIGTPDFYAPDEQSHFNYIKFLAEHRSFPIQASKTDAATNDWEYYQPPLYYLTQAPIYWLSNSILPGDAHALRAIRLGSVAIWLASILCAWRFILNMGVKSNALQIIVIGIMSLLPTYTFLSAMINNDNLVVCLGGVLLCLIARRQFTAKTAALIGLVLGLAVLTKFSAMLYAPVILFVGLLQVRMRREQFFAVFSYMVIVALVSLMVISAWLHRNYTIYGSLSAESVANVPYAWPSIMAGLSGTFKNAITTFWAVSGIYNNVHSFFPFFGITISALSCLGFIHAAMKGRSLAFSGELEPSLLGVFALSIAINALLVMRFGLLYAQGQGRFFFPLLAPIALLLGIGLHSLRLRLSDVSVSGFLIAYGSSFTVFSLASFPRV